MTSNEGEGGRETARIHMTSGRADSDGRTRSEARTLTAEDPVGRRSWANRSGILLDDLQSGRTGPGLSPSHHDGTLWRHCQGRWCCGRGEAAADLGALEVWTWMEMAASSSSSSSSVQVCAS